MRAEPILAKLNELRHDAEGDKTDIEYLALHHAFCFISYKMGEFQKYLEEAARSEKPISEPPAPAGGAGRSPAQM
jgi:hypothetical protein